MAQLWNREKQRQCVQPQGQYLSFGLYAHGAQHGMTSRSQALPCVVRYMNQFMSKHAHESGLDVQTWTTLTVGLNAGSVMHRDCHNLPESRNLIIGLGNYRGGELWRAVGANEQPRHASNTKWRAQRDGTRVRGVQECIRHRPTTFDPFVPHATCKWSGPRFVITAHSSRALTMIGPDVRSDLRGLGFPLPRVPEPRQVMSVNKNDHLDTQEESWQVQRQITAPERAFCLNEARNYVNEVDDILARLPRGEAAKLHVLEVGSRNGHLQQALEDRNGQHTNMADRGLDVSRRRDSDAALQVLREIQPQWLWLAPVCESRHPEGRSEKAQAHCRKRWKQAAQTCVRLAQAQMSEGRQVVWEWPKHTSSWHRLEVREFFRHLLNTGQAFEGLVHACAADVQGDPTSPQSSRVWRVWTTSQSLTQLLSMSCPGNHEHVREDDLLSRVPGNLPIHTCRRAVQEMLLQNMLDREQEEQLYEEHDHVFSSLQSEGHECHAVSELSDPEKMTKEERVIHAQLMKLHRRCGHPGNRALVNLLRTREVEEHVIRIAQNLKCDECQQLKINEPHSVVNLERCEVLWHTLQIDHIDFRWQDTVIHVLVMTDDSQPVHQLSKRCFEGQ